MAAGFADLPSPAETVGRSTSTIRTTLLVNHEGSVKATRRFHTFVRFFEATQRMTGRSEGKLYDTVEIERTFGSRTFVKESNY